MFLRTKIVLITLLTGLTLLLINCSPPDDSTQEYERWTSTDPLAINLRARQLKYEAGNLVFNPSFEMGRIVYLDSLTYNTDIDGWTLIGQGARWIHDTIDSMPVDPDQVNSGLRSICIKRETAGETEEYGSGVLSDYIKVIPGNYKISLRLNLKEINNPKSRRGERLNDAVDIKLVYYDRNRIQINSEQEAPSRKIKFDNSFKSLSLSNYTRIDSSGWIHIIGKSILFPFPDGDLQDDTKFVRLFIGLKGNGTLWVDDVSFEYTRWNFSLKERLDPYFDTTLSKSNVIVPQPKQVDILESLIYYRPYYKELFPVILIPNNSEAYTRKAAENLEQTIRDLLVNQVGIVPDSIPKLIKTNVSKDELANALVFSLGETYLYNEFRTEVPLEAISDYPKGFVIHTPKDNSNLVFLQANKSLGIFYASCVVQQLFDHKKLLYHTANVIDYPSSENNALLLEDINKTSVNYLMNADRIRFDQLYIQGGSKPFNDFFMNSDLASDFRLRYVIGLKASQQRLSTISDEIGEFKNMAVKFSNIEGLSIMQDYVLESASQKVLQNHASVYPNGVFLSGRDEQTLLNLNNSGYDTEVMPCFGDNQSLIKAFSDPLSLYVDISSVSQFPIVWAGNAYQSYRIDEADYRFYKKYYSGVSAFLDLSMYPRSSQFDYFAMDTLWPYKLQMAGIFEAYSNEIVPEVYQMAGKTILMGSLNSVIDKIRLTTASDFFWNPEAYNPDVSIHRALVQEFGELYVEILIDFNDAYFKLKSQLILLAQNKNINKHLRRIDFHSGQLTNYLEELKAIADSEVQEEMTGILFEMAATLQQEVDRLKPVNPDK